MPESAQHAQLVGQILQWVQAEYGENDGLAILTDSIAVASPYRPSRIEGFCPDVEVRTVPSSIIILGEAKSFADVSEPHTERQVSAFLQFLGMQIRPIFIFAVPLGALGAGRSLVRRVQKRTETRHVPTIFLFG